MEQMIKESLEELITYNPELNLKIKNALELINTFKHYECSRCGRVMIEGYCINLGEYIYCSDDCMTKDGFSIDDFIELQEEDSSTSYLIKKEVQLPLK